jgi:hypothetical protein
MPKTRNGARARTRAPGKADDLTVIEGIGATRSQWLQTSLGVQTYADLAALSADEVVAALRAAGQVASPSVVASWIARARELAGAAEHPDWVPLASFVVEFQGCQATPGLRTAVHHVEADETEAWPGIETERVSEWMLERAPEPAEEAVPAPAPPAESPRERVRIGLMRVVRDGEATSPGERVVGRAFARWLRGNEPFTLEVPLELISTGAAPRGDHRVRLYAENLATSARTHLGDATAEEDPQSYAAVLTGCRLPEGVYRLSVLVSEGERLTPTVLEAPLLRVG